MNFRQRLTFWIGRLVLAVIDAKSDKAEKEIRECEISIAQNLARLASLPTNAIEVTLLRYPNGWVTPKVVINTLVTEEQLASVNSFLMGMNDVHRAGQVLSTPWVSLDRESN